MTFDDLIWVWNFVAFSRRLNKNKKNERVFLAHGAGCSYEKALNKNNEKE